MAFLSQRTNPWGSTRACGMPMTGPQEEGWWRPIGPRLLSQLTTETSRPLSSLQSRSLMQNGRAAMSLMLMEEEDSDGFRSTSWSIITAMTWSDSLKAFLSSVGVRGSKRCRKFRVLCWWVWMNETVSVKYIYIYIYGCLAVIL